MKIRWLLGALACGSAVAAPRPPSVEDARISPQLRLVRDMPQDAQRSWMSEGRVKRQSGHFKVHVTLKPGLEAESFVREHIGLQKQIDVQVSLGREFQAAISFEDLRLLSGFEEVHKIRFPFYASKKEYYSEGTAALFEGEQWSELGITGEGVTVAVIDVGFEGYDALLGSELPLYTNADGLAAGWEEDNHGAAVAEIIHDVAPGAQLDLYSFETELEFRKLLQQFVDGEYEADVINASIGFDNVWTADGTSPYAQAVDAVVEAGIVYVAAAGNEAENYRWGKLTDIDGNGFLEINGEEGTWIAGGNYGGDSWAEVSLRWSDAMEGSSTDLDLLVTNETDTVECGRSENPQEGDDNPFEYVSCLLDSDWGLAWIADYSEGGFKGKTAWVYSYSGVDESQFVQDSTLTLPADASGALTVGAYLQDEDKIAWYSSQGPTEDGRIKPDVVGPTGVSTESMGHRAAQGTSFSAPHLAGLAALILEQKPGYSVEALREYVLKQTRDLGETGPDSVFGHGAIAVTTLPEGCGCASSETRRGGWLVLMLFAGVALRRRP